MRAAVTSVAIILVVLSVANAVAQRKPDLPGTWRPVNVPSSAQDLEKTAAQTLASSAAGATSLPRGFTPPQGFVIDEKTSKTHREGQQLSITTSVNDAKTGIEYLGRAVSLPPRV